MTIGAHDQTAGHRSTGFDHELMTDAVTGVVNRDAVLRGKFTHTLVERSRALARCRRITVAYDLFFFRIPLDFAPNAQRNIGEMTRRSDLVAAFDIGNGALTAFDAVDEIADVQVELLIGGTRLFDLCDPRLRLDVFMLR